MHKNSKKQTLKELVIDNKTVFFLERKTTLVVEHKRDCFVAVFPSL